MTAIRRTPLHAATVAAAVDLTPRMRRLTLHVPTLETTRPAQDVELVLTDDTGRKVKRRYTIRAHRPDMQEIDVDALLHGHGPGSRWAETAAAGDPISFFGPRGRIELREAAWHLFAGDESSLPAIATLIDALPPSVPVTAFLEVDSAADEIDIRGARYLHRGDTPAGGPALLRAALAEFTPPDGAGQGYLLGESRAVAALRPVLHALGLANDALYVKGYWNVGRPGRP